MRELEEPSPHAPTELDDLRQAHLADRPWLRQRELLISELQRLHPAERDDSSSHPRRASTLWSQPLPWLLSATCGTALVAALVIASESSQRIEPEPTAPNTVAAPPVADRTTTGERSLAVTSAHDVACVRARGDDGLLDDFEQGAPVGAPLVVRQRDGRSGKWFHTRNIGGTGFQTEPLMVLESPEATPENRHALMIAGEPPIGWGANAGIRFDHCYDASAYAGIEFRVRGRGLLFLGLQTLDSVPTDFGGRCTQKCWFTAGRYIALSEQFETHRIRWKDVTAPDPTYAFAKELMQIMFSVQADPQPYEFWLDDLRLITENE